MTTENGLTIEAQELDSGSMSDVPVNGYEVNDLREEGDAELSDWMTKLLLKKEFQLVGASNLQAIFAKLEPVNYKAGQPVIKQGDSGTHFFVITSGRCIVSRELPTNRGTVKLAELSVGDTFGEEALITDATRQATVSMATAGTVMRLSKEDFNKLLSEPIVQRVDRSQADDILSKDGVWLNVDFTENVDQADPENVVRIPTYLLRLKLDQLDMSKRYVVTGRKYSHARAAAHILQQSGFNACVLDQDDITG
ncbi:MAG: cyclic nucleotide-binding domain-containing protein [Gammaproteobacteria bacterium]